jgi:flagellin-like protein
MRWDYMKKAEMGVGTLIIFIAMLLVAAVAAGVLIQTAGSLQEKSLATGQQARSQISTNAETVEVSATDGRDGLLNDFHHLLKLAPGSDEIKLEQVIFTFNTKDKSSTLKYRGTEGICRRNVTSGYVTRKMEVVDEQINVSVWYTFNEDIDYDDVYTDRVHVAQGGDALEFDLSSVGLYNYSIASLTGAGVTPVTFAVSRENINAVNTSYGKIQINGTTDIANTTLANMITVFPYKEGEGFFTVEYLQEGTNYVAGNLQKGDLIKLCYEAPQDIGEDIEVRLNFIPKIGTASLTEFVTPDVVSTERAYLYP